MSPLFALLMFRSSVIFSSRLSFCARLEEDHADGEEDSDVIMVGERFGTMLGGLALRTLMFGVAGESGGGGVLLL